MIKISEKVDKPTLTMDSAIIFHSLLKKELIQNIYLYLPFLLPFHFSSSEPPFSHISLFLNEINPSLQVKSEEI